MSRSNSFCLLRLKAKLNETEILFHSIFIVYEVALAKVFPDKVHGLWNHTINDKTFDKISSARLQFQANFLRMPVMNKIYSYINSDSLLFAAA